MTPGQKWGVAGGGIVALCGAVLLGVAAAEDGPPARPRPSVTPYVAPTASVGTAPATTPPVVVVPADTPEDRPDPPTRATDRTPLPRRVTTPPPATPGPDETEPVTGAGYESCTELRVDYPFGVASDHSAYEPRFDRDGDGWACELGEPVVLLPNPGGVATSPAAAPTTPASPPTTAASAAEGI